MWVLQGSFTAFSRVERDSGVGLLALCRKLTEGTLTLEEMVAVLFHCGDAKLPLPVIQERLIRGGMVAAVEAIAALFSGVLSATAPEENDPPEF